MVFGQRLKKAREYAGLTQEQLAEKSGIDQRTISKIERGDQQGTTAIVDLARACNVDPGWLSSGTGDMVIPGSSPPTQGKPPTQGESMRDAVAARIANIAKRLTDKERLELLDKAIELLDRQATEAGKGGATGS